MNRNPTTRTAPLASNVSKCRLTYSSPGSRSDGNTAETSTSERMSFSMSACRLVIDHVLSSYALPSMDTDSNRS